MSSGTNNILGTSSQFLIIHWKRKISRFPIKFLASNEQVQVKKIFSPIPLKTKVIKTSVLHTKDISVHSFAKIGNNRPTLRAAETFLKHKLF